MEAHHLQDYLLYLPFLAGQFMYFLKRASFSMRAGRAPTRRAYFWHNWDILLFRAGIAVFFYAFFRHYSLGQVVGFFHVDLSSVSWLKFIFVPLSSPLAFWGLGIGVDGLIDWAVDWASRKENTKVPQRIKDWLTENVTPVPNGDPK